MDINECRPGTLVHIAHWADTEFQIIGIERVRDMFNVWREMVAITTRDGSIAGHARPDEITAIGA